MGQDVMLTRGVPLVLVHLALAVGVDDAHALQERGKLGLLLVLLEHLVELLFVHLPEAVLCREPVRGGGPISYPA